MSDHGGEGRLHENVTAGALDPKSNPAHPVNTQAHTVKYRVSLLDVHAPEPERPLKRGSPLVSAVRFWVPSSRDEARSYHGEARGRWSVAATRHRRRRLDYLEIRSIRHSPNAPPASVSRPTSSSYLAYATGRRRCRGDRVEPAFEAVRGAIPGGARCCRRYAR